MNNLLDWIYVVVQITFILHTHYRQDGTFSSKKATEAPIWTRQTHKRFQVAGVGIAVGGRV